MTSLRSLNRCTGGFFRLVLTLFTMLGASAFPADESDSKKTPADHWAFQPVRKPALPGVTHREWVRNPIDSFILQRLEKENFSPAPEAGRRALIRRLSLDLVGLLPEEAAVTRFLNDHSPLAYESLVDRLLASPHFGERWGRHWLDEARYGDSDGYSDDRVRPWAWTYRDWVIDSINRDQPFDQFTIEQLAGDLLPNATPDQLRATGFHRNTLSNREGGVDPEEFRIKAAGDRVSTTATVWLGLTLGCAECHNHKYDPLKQEDYYRMLAFFNNDEEVDEPIWLPGDRQLQRPEMAEWKAKNLQLAAELDRGREAVLKTFEEWKSNLRKNPSPWTLLRPAAVRNTASSTLRILPDHSILAEEFNPASEVYFVVITNQLQAVRSVRLDFLDLPGDAHGLGRSRAGGFVITAVELSLDQAGSASRPIALSRASATFSDPDRPAAGLAKNATQGWGVLGDPFLHQALVLETAEAISTAPGDKLVIVLRQAAGEQRNVRRFQVSVSEKTSLEPDHLRPDATTVAQATAQSDVTGDQTEALLQSNSELRELNRAYENHLMHPPFVAARTAQVLRKNPYLRQTFIHVRGDFLRKGKEVTADIPSLFRKADAPGGAPSRLDLARWLVDPNHPLTARVTVNKVWQHLFGQGLVSTPSDFGGRGEKPSHPELLDWLASTFIASQENGGLNWSRKQLIRLIVTSNTYRQASDFRPELSSVDPLNRLLARQNRTRVEAEVVRDLNLQAAGLLNLKIGGPGIRPPLPADVARLGWSISYPESAPPESYRRGCYIVAQRTVLYPMLVTFDAPDPTLTCPRRERSNSPLQALTTLNDPVFAECARALGRNLAKLSGSSASRLEQAFRICFQRAPTSRESELLLKAGRDLAVLWEKSGNPTEGALAPVELENRAWYALARTLLNLDEFTTRE